MELSLPYSDFNLYVQKQLEHFFPDKIAINQGEWNTVMDKALDRTAFCFKHVTLPAYNKNGSPFLNHLHSDQYAVFLWFLSNTIWKESQNEIVANKLFYLNKALHGISVMYNTALPDIFLLLHTVGTVLGRATYGDFFVASQGCTVGAQNDCYPLIGKGVGLLPNSSVIGDCRVGNRSVVGINATVYQDDIDQDQVVFVDSDGKVQRKLKNGDAWTQRFFNVSLKDVN
ncbi:serine acetyltransferase [Paenibacillus aceris]|uniref:Serine O-acetyltransferase n=1 Tax=Paenibacillus aceris TaxID=869555 RepID=A0ABS4I4I1_9BACL|nr:serine acetyltransferase [Paenibacillus aceris]MBP1965818.1 serine O-acetyltransferase [Paenibacillus aceris]NHW34836.1 serine acetyltransferase [Paenibacillus aceris]